MIFLPKNKGFQADEIEEIEINTIEPLRDDVDIVNNESIKIIRKIIDYYSASPVYGCAANQAQYARRLSLEQQYKNLIEGNTENASQFVSELRGVFEYKSLMHRFSTQELSHIEALLYDKKINTSSIDLGNIVVEVQSPKQNGKERSFNFDYSLSHLRNRGYDRHLRPDELFKIFISALENPDDSLKCIQNDMMSSSGEWLSACFQVSKDGKDLTIYLHPQNIKFNAYENRHFIDDSNNDVICLYYDTFHLERTSTTQWGKHTKKRIELMKEVPLSQVHEVNPELVGFLCSKPYDELPRSIRDNTILKLPSPNLPSIVYFYPENNNYNIYSYDYMTNATHASRGVKIK